MSGPYDDIINLPRPTSSGHPRMPICDRAFIFSPFAALAGHGAAIVGTVRRTEQRMERGRGVPNGHRPAEKVQGTGTDSGSGGRDGDPAGGCGGPGERYLPDAHI